MRVGTRDWMDSANHQGFATVSLGGRGPEPAPDPDPGVRVTGAEKGWGKANNHQPKSKTTTPQVTTIDGAD